MLDVSLRAGVLALPARLARLPTERGPGAALLPRLLSTRVVTDKVLVHNQGIVVEQIQTTDVLQHPTRRTR